MASTTVAFEEPDIYGQVHPTETPELVAEKLAALDVEVDKIPAEKKPQYQLALDKCPQLVDQDVKLQFLRCEVFNADLAAKRLVSYWEKRVEIFGPVDAFKPLTLQADGALVEDSVALEIGLMRLTGAKDDSGRIILFADPSRQDKTKYTTKSMAKAVWYVLHAALEDEDAQKHGIVLVVFPHKAKVTQMDRQLIKLLAGSLKDRIPVRLAGFHICHPPTFFRVIFPIISLVLGPRLRKRIRIHAGSTEKVQEELNAYGLTRNKLPSELEGEIVLDHQAWLEQRRAAGK